MGASGGAPEASQNVSSLLLFPVDRCFRRGHRALVRVSLTAVLTGLGLNAALAQQAYWPPADTAPRRADAGKPASSQTDRLIVRYQDAGTTSGPSASRQQHARSVGARWGLSLQHQRRTALGADVYRLGRLVDRAELQAVMAELKRQDPDVVSVEPDVRVRALATRVSDPYLTRQWNLWDFDFSIWAPYAWNYSRGAGVVIAVLDTGVLPHPDLQANLVSGYDFVSDVTNANDGDARDADASDPGDWADAGLCDSSSAASSSTWHGSHVAGIAAASGYNAVGITGVAYNAKVMPVRVLGRCGGYASDFADAIFWSAGGAISGVPSTATPARVINLSLGGTAACPSVVQQAIYRARALGAVVVAAAGNEAAEASTSMPANCAGVVSVAATARNGSRASYSNFGDGVSLAAPGGDWDAGIWSTVSDGATTPGNYTYATYLGTSMAAPHVSGVVALMLFANKNMNPDQVQNILVNTASWFANTCEGCGAGVVNALDAVQTALDASWNELNVAEVEPNNALGTAQAIPSTPTIVSGSIASNTDADFYKVQVAGGSKLVSTLTATSASNFDLYVYDALGRQVGYSVNAAGAADAVTVTNTAATMASYIVRVVRNSGSTGAYTLTLRN